MPKAVGIGISPIFSMNITDYAEFIQTIEPANLIGYWPLNESVSLEENYLTFDGTDTKINCGSDASIDDIADDAFTVEAWFKTDGGGESQYEYIAEKSGGEPFNRGWGFWLYPSIGKIRGEVACVTTDAFGDADVGLSGDGEWHHATMYYDDAGDRKIYIALDGVWASSYTTQDAGVDAIVTDAAEALVLGNRIGTDRTLSGALGWVRISNNDRHNHGVDFTPPSRTTIPDVDANTVGLWPMNEGYGSVAGDLSANNNDGTITDGSWGSYPGADNAEGTEARDGTYTGVTLGQSQSPFTCPLFDGINDYVNVYSASFDAAFDGAAGTISVFGKVSGSGVWSDNQHRYFFGSYADGDNTIRIQKDNNNDLYWRYESNNIPKIITKGSMSETGWMHVALTWDAVADELKAYYNGVQEGGTLTSLGTWTAANLNSNLVCIGTLNTGATYVWDGYLAHCAVWTKALTADQILAIYNASGVGS